jgi:nucleotide-binding universal stress UspA family protein
MLPHEPIRRIDAIVDAERHARLSSSRSSASGLTPPRGNGVIDRYPCRNCTATLVFCGVDGSGDSRAAVDVAAQLASRLGTRLVLAHVAEVAQIPYAPAAPFAGMARPAAFEHEIDSQQEVSERLLARIAFDAGLVDAERRVAVGLPAERLAELADAEKAELIVVGLRGRGAFKAAFLGSISNSLLGVARCPVLIVPPGAREVRE